MNIVDQEFSAKRTKYFGTTPRQQIAPPTAKLQRPAFLDASIAIGVLVLTLPLLMIIAVVIRLEGKGPILFRQTRTGLDGRKFQIFKFRTMRVLDNGPVVAQATRDDPRVTAVGRVLRKTSLDELPQLVNVLRGEMALVGPRPHALAHDEYYSQRIQSYGRRFSVKPGLTGWAQINGARGETPTIAHMERRIELDIWYIENKSLALDMRILALTALSEISRKTNVY